MNTPDWLPDLKEILTYFEFHTLQDWVLFFIKDIFVSAIVTVGILKLRDWLSIRLRAGKIARQLLRDSTPSYESPAKMIAHRFLNIYDQRNNPLQSRRERWKRENAWSSSSSEWILDEELQRYGLVEVFTDEKHNDKRVHPSITQSRNEKLASLVYRKLKRKLS